MPFVPFAFRTTRVTVYCPGLKYTCGFWTFDNCPLPKSQFQNFGSPVEASLNSISNVAQPVVTLEVKSAPGAWLLTSKPVSNKPIINKCRINSSVLDH